MAIFRNPHGVEVSAAEAKIGSKLHPGYTESLADGESVHFNMLLMRDANPKSDKTSIDEELRETIARLAKNNGLTPSEYLEVTPMAEIQRLAAEASEKVIESLSGKGMASKLADYRTKSLADTKTLSAARYAGAPMIEAADSETPTQPSMGGYTGSDATAAIRNLRYQ